MKLTRFIAPTISSAALLTLLLLPPALLGKDRGGKGRAPWGRAKVLDVKYKPSKVIYDVVTGNPRRLGAVFSKAGYLANNIYGANPFDARVVIVLHGDSIKFFAHKNFRRYRALMERAQGLTQGGVVEFRMCLIRARMAGFKPRDIHGFVKMVPMADAEIVRLQKNGYAYMYTH